MNFQNFRGLVHQLPSLIWLTTVTHYSMIHKGNQDNFGFVNFGELVLRAQKKLSNFLGHFGKP